MNTWIVVSTLAALFAGQSSNAPQWTDDYAVALAATKKTQRPLLIVIDDPRRVYLTLSHVSIATDKSQENLLADFQLCRIDAATDYGRKVADSFKVKQYPHMAIIDRTGSVILHQQSGRIDNNQWATTLALHRSGIHTPPRPVEVARTACIR